MHVCQTQPSSEGSSIQNSSVESDPKTACMLNQSSPNKDCSILGAHLDTAFKRRTVIFACSRPPVKCTKPCTDVSRMSNAGLWFKERTLLNATYSEHNPRQQRSSSAVPIIASQASTRHCHTSQVLVSSFAESAQRALCKNAILRKVTEEEPLAHI
jgi:hypothetical protein